MRSLFVLLFLLGCGGAQEQGQVPGPTTEGHEVAHDEVRAAPERAPLGETRRVSMPSRSPVISIRVSFDAGSIEDPEGHRGLTNLTATLMAEGGAGDLSYAERLRALYPMAAEIGVQVDREQTVFIARVHTDHLEAFRALFMDMLAHPRFDAADFERVKAQAIVGLTELRNDDDEELGKELLQAAIYRDHPYGYPVLGVASELGALTRDDVVQQRERVFCGARATVGVAGNAPAGFLERLASEIGAIRSEACVGRLNASPVPQRTSAVWAIDKPSADSVAVSMGVPIDVTRGDADYPALFVAASYLGQHRQFIGQLMQKIREQRGMNYGDYAYSEHFDQEGWSTFPVPNASRRQQYFSVWLRPLQPAHAAFAIRFAVRELAQLHDHGMNAESFEAVRRYLDGYLALFLQTESRRLGYAIDDEMYGLATHYLERMRRALRELTVEQVNDAFRRHVRVDALQIAVVAPNAGTLLDELARPEGTPVQYDATRTDAMRVEDEATQHFNLGIARSSMSIVPVAEAFQ